MKTKMMILLGLATVGVAVAALMRRYRSNTPDHDRAEQTTPEGKPVVEEWGEESFPASDPQQSW